MEDRLITFLPSMYSDDDDDPGPDDDDDPEGDCMSFHQCYGGSQWGYCLLRKGHDGAHQCTKCGNEF